MTASFQLQPGLSNSLVGIRPLAETDFETLYAIASDPLLWEQHPNRDRYKREVFEVFFKGAMDSGGAFLVYEVETGVALGSSRFYEVDANMRSVKIGYTFVARPFWGKGYNRALKLLMLAHAFTFADTVYFDIGAVNIRSQKAIEKLGAVKMCEEEVSYYGEEKKMNYRYCIDRDCWQKLRSQTF